MKKILFICVILLGLSTVVCHAKTSSQPLDQIVAVVNDDVVTKTELSHALSIAHAQMEHEQVPIPADKEFRKQVLDQLINKKLQLQVAKQAGINITETDLNNAIRHIAEQNHLSVNELYQHLNEDGMSTAEYRKEIREQMAMQQLQQHEVSSRINVTPQEIVRFKKTNVWKSEGPKEYHVEDILIPLSENPSVQELSAASMHASTIITKLKSGAALSQVADNQIQTNDLGWLKLPELPSIFTNQVAKMQAHDVAGPIQAPNGLHILRLSEVRALSGVRDAAPDAKQIEQLLLQHKFEQAMQTWVSKLRGQAFIVVKPA